MARQISDFVQDVRARGPYTAAQNVAEDAVLRTAIDLCERGGAWQFEYAFDVNTNGVAGTVPDVMPEEFSTTNTLAGPVATSWANAVGVRCTC